MEANKFHMEQNIVDSKKMRDTSLSGNDIVLTCTCTCMLMSGEADALNAHILLPKLVESVFESISGRCFNDMLRKLIPVPHDSLAEEHSTNTTCVPCLRQFQTVPS